MKNVIIPGDIVFAATGVTNGARRRDIRYFSGGAKPHSIVMRSKTRTIRVIETRQRFDFKPEY